MSDLCPHCEGEMDEFGGVHLRDCPAAQPTTGETPEAECYSCGEKNPAKECPKSKRPCGHHCNCSWVHDHCHWCGKEFGEEPVGCGGSGEVEPLDDTLFANGEMERCGGCRECQPDCNPHSSTESKEER